MNLPSRLITAVATLFVPVAAFASTSTNCSPYMCADGTSVPRCSAEGYPINYFVAPCQMHGGEVTNDQSFSDVPATHENADAIAYVKAEGIVSGYPDGTYRPDAKINRAEFTKIVTGSPRTCDSPLHFNDTEDNAWYTPYLCHAVAADIISGYPDGSFRPANLVNFVEASKILAKTYFANYEKDTDSVWYESAVTVLGTRKAIPTTITRFDQFITRGEMAEIIYRLRAENTSKPSQTFDSLQNDLQLYTNTKYRFSLKYPAGNAVLSNGYATKPEEASNVIVGPVSIDILDTDYWSQTPDYASHYKEYMTLPVEEYARAVRQMNLDDKNPYVTHGVGDLELLAISGHAAYRFWATGAFTYERGSWILNEKTYFLFFSSRGITYMFSYDAADAAAAEKEIDSFTEF